MIRARVYEIQWGGSVMDYVQYFADEKALEKFNQETGWRVEVEA